MFELTTPNKIAGKVGAKATGSEATHSPTIRLDQAERFAGIQQLTDPEAKAAFAKSERSLRCLPSAPVELKAECADDSDLAAARRNHRAFHTHALAAESILSLLSPLRHHAERKLRYASAGGLYPVQTYICIPDKPDAAQRIQGLASGTYYFDPKRFALVPSAGPARLPASAFGMLNAPVADASSFTLFLTTELAAIAPIYGVDALRLSMIEAGAMTQLIEERAIEVGIGLCHIGSFDIEAHRQALGFDTSHALMHTLIGGPPRTSEIVEEVL